MRRQIHLVAGFDDRGRDRVVPATCAQRRHGAFVVTAREAERILKPQGHALDWFAFADAWRAEYQPGMEEVRAGRIPFSKLDVLHRRNLDRILPRFKISDLADDVARDLRLRIKRTLDEAGIETFVPPALPIA